MLGIPVDEGGLVDGHDEDRSRVGRASLPPAIVASISDLVVGLTRASVQLEFTLAAVAAIADRTSAQKLAQPLIPLFHLAHKLLHQVADLGRQG
jgi:hypothetical protein